MGREESRGAPAATTLDEGYSMSLGDQLPPPSSIQLIAEQEDAAADLKYQQYQAYMRRSKRLQHGLVLAAATFICIIIAVLPSSFFNGLSAMEEIILFGMVAIMLAFAFGQYFFSRHHSYFYRRTHNSCIHCGYSLRGSPERCPECGTSAPRVISMPTPAESAAIQHLQYPQDRR